MEYHQVFLFSYLLYPIRMYSILPIIQNLVQPIPQSRFISCHRLEQLYINHLLSICVSGTVLSDYLYQITVVFITIFSKILITPFWSLVTRDHVVELSITACATKILNYSLLIQLAMTFHSTKKPVLTVGAHTHTHTHTHRGTRTYFIYLNNFCLSNVTCLKDHSIESLLISYSRLILF